MKKPDRKPIGRAVVPSTYYETMQYLEGSRRLEVGDEVRMVSSPGHRVTCRRWFAHHDPRDAQGLLNSEIFGNCVIAPFTKKYVNAAAHEQVG